jgi:hypothetical protein
VREACQEGAQPRQEKPYQGSPIRVDRELPVNPYAVGSNLTDSANNLIQFQLRNDKSGVT